MSINNELTKKASFIALIIGALIIAYLSLGNNNKTAGEPKNTDEIVKSSEAKQTTESVSGAQHLIEVTFKDRLTDKQIQFYKQQGIDSIEHKSANSYYFYTNRYQNNLLEKLTTEKNNKVPIVSIKPVAISSKIPIDIQNGQVGDWAVTDTGAYRLNIEFLQGISPQEIKTILEKKNIFIEDESLIHRGIVSVVTTPTRVNDLAGIESVISIDTVSPPLTTNNLDAASYNNVEPLFAEGDINGVEYQLSGANIDVLVIDGGQIRDSHQEFQVDNASKVKNITSVPLNDHATHVAGTVAAIGIDENARGIAKGTGIYGYSFLDTQWNNTQMENAFELYNLKLSNNSYGLASIHRSLLGKYRLESKEMDDTIYNNPKLLVIKSAGNDRDNTDQQYRKVYGITKGFSNSKNVITVGAASDSARAVEGTDGMTTFSSWGPVLDGRIKPDIVANGDTLYSLAMRSDDSYGVKSGTSMSAPVTTGISALLIQEYQRLMGSQNIRADMLKALLVNTATDLGTEGPDYSYGFGMVNAQKAVDTLKTIKQGGQLFLNSISLNETKTYRLSLTEPARVKLTVSWLDIGANINNQDNTLVNDIDILLSSAQEAFYPYTLDKLNPANNAKRNAVNNIDNTEQIEFNLQPGEYTLAVKGSQIVNDKQIYALVSSHDLVYEGQSNVVFDTINDQSIQKGQSGLLLPITFSSDDNNFAYIDAYSDDDNLSLDVDKNNILTISSASNNANSYATVTVSAMVSNVVYETSFAVNLLDAIPKFKPTFNAYRNFKLDSPVDFKHITFNNNKIYASDYLSNTIKVFDLTGQLLEEFGDNLANPQGLLFINNKLYVADSNNNQVQIYNNNVYEDSFGLSGADDGQFNFPNAIAQTSDGNIYISDRFNNRVQVFDASHQFIKTLELKLSDRTFYDTVSLTANNQDDLFIVDRYANKIHKFDTEQNHITVFGEYGASAGTLDLPEAIVSDLNDDVYILDNNGLQIFNAYGDFVDKISTDLSLQNPSAISLNDNYLYVFDARDNHIKVFDLFSIRKKLDQAGNLNLLAGEFTQASLYNSVTIERIKIDSLPNHGKIFNLGSELQVGSIIEAVDISINYVPDTNEKRDDEFTFSAANNAGFTQNSMTVFIANNLPPQINLVNDQLVLDEDSEGSFLVIDNDNLSATVTITSDASHGQVIIDGNKITYIANAGYSGSDSFTIQIDDGDGGVVTKQVTVTVNEKNDAPVITNNELQQWQYLSGATDNNGVDYHQVVIDNNHVPYIIYFHESNSDKTIVVKQFINNEWLQLGDTEVALDNLQANRLLAFDSNNTPFIVFSDRDNSGRISVKKYNGAQWEYVGTSTGISTARSNSYSIAVDGNNVPYILYENPARLSHLIVKKLESNTWVDVSVEGFDGSNWMTTSIDEFSDRIPAHLIIDHNNQPIVAYKDYENLGRLGVKRFADGIWQSISGGGISDSLVTQLQIGINHKDELLVAYTEIENNSQVSVKKYVNNDWNYVGIDSISESNAMSLSLGFNSENIPYIAYQTDVNENGIIIKSFNNDRWQEVNVFSDTEINSPKLIIDQSQLIVAYFNQDQIKTIQLNDSLTTTIVEDELSVTTILATDSDDSVIDYQLVEGYDSHLFEINASGEISFIVPPDYEQPKDFNEDGVYIAYAKVADNSVFTMVRVEVKVASRNGLGDQVGNGTSSDFAANVNQVRDFAITLEDIAGNISNHASFTVIKDTVAPTKPSVYDPIFATSNNQELIDIYAQAGTLLFINGVSANQIVDINGKVSVTLDTNTIGNHSYQITVKDAAGNESEVLQLNISKFSYSSNKGYAQLGSLNLVDADIRIYEIVDTGQLNLLFTETSDQNSEFDLHVSQLQADKFYLYEVLSGRNNQGTLRAVAKGSWLIGRTDPLIVSLASEMVYDLVAKYIKYDFSVDNFEAQLNTATALVVQDLNSDAVVDGLDSLIFNFHNSAHQFHTKYTDIDDIAKLVQQGDLSYINQVFAPQDIKQYMAISNEQTSSMLISKNQQYAYLSTAGGLKILDISNPLQPQEVVYKEDNRLSNISKAYLSNNAQYYIFVSEGTNNIIIADVSNPHDIQLSGNIRVYDDEIVDIKFQQDNQTAVILYKSYIAKIRINSISSLALTYKVGLGNLLNNLGSGALELSKDNSTLYIIGKADNKILVVDTSSNRLMKQVLLEKTVDRIALLDNEKNIVAINQKSAFLVNIENILQPVISSQYNEDIQTVKYAFMSSLGNKFVSNTVDGYRVLDVNNNYQLSKDYLVEAFDIQQIVSSNGYKAYARQTAGVSVYDYDMFKNSLEQDQQLVTKNDHIEFTVYGKIGEKVFVNGVDTGVVISASGSATVVLSFEEYTNNKDFSIRVGSGGSQTSFVLVVAKELDLPEKPSLTETPYTTTQTSETVEVQAQIGTVVYVNGVSTGQTIGNSGRVTINLPVNNEGDNYYVITVKNSLNIESEALQFSINKFVYHTDNSYAQLGESNLIGATIKIYEIVSSGNLRLLHTETSGEGGTFDAHLASLQANTFYLYEVSKGEGSEGYVRAVVKAEWLQEKTQPFIISVASEMVYNRVAKYIQYDFNTNTFADLVNTASTLVVQDVNADNLVDAKDSILFNQQLNHNLHINYQNIDDIVNLIKNNNLNYIDLVFNDQSSEPYIYNIDDNISSMLISRNEKYAYLSTNSGLKVFDITNPLQPQQIAVNSDTRLRNITQAYLSDDEKTYVVVSVDGKKITPVNIESLASIDIGEEVPYLSTSSDDRIVSLSFVDGDKKLYVLTQKTIGYFIINDVQSLTLETRLGGLEQYIDTFSGFVVSNSEQVYFIGEDNNKLLILDMPNLTLTGYFSISGQNIHSVTLSDNDRRLTVYDEFGIILLDMAEDNRLSLAGYQALDIVGQHAALSTYGKTFFISNNNELLSYNIHSDSTITDDYTITYSDVEAETSIVSLSGNRIYTHNNQRMKIYDYALFKPYSTVQQPILISSIAEYTNQSNITLNLAGQKNDNIIINGQAIGETVNAFFAESIDYSLQAEDGLNTLNVQFERLGALSDPLVINITKDTIEPQIIDFIPTDKNRLLSDDITINLNYQDNIGIDIKNSTIYLDNVEIDKRAIKENSFTYLLNLEDKRYKISAKLVDFAGNVTEHEYTFVVNTQSPKVRASIPGADYTYAFDVALLTDSNSIIYYTTDGTTPDENSANYSQPIPISATTTLRYFAKNTISDKTSSIHTEQYNLDLSGPQVVTGYPSHGQTFAMHDEFSYTFTSANAISEITIIDKLGADLSSYIHRDGNRVSLDIAANQNRLYELTLVATDDQGNTTSIPLEFWVDTVPPTTIASVTSGDFDQAISIDLLSNEDSAKIYYSTDGYPPVIGTPNTVGGESVIRNIPITETTNLQFFAVDEAGNVETTNTEIYYFDDLLASGTTLSLNYQQTNQRVDLSWNNDVNATSYYIYRVDNIIDQEVLQDSINAAYPAPKKYLLATVNTSTYNDNNISNGAKYYYAVSKVVGNVETIISDIADIEINNSNPIQTTTESISRAVNYLKKAQNSDGSWSSASRQLSLLYTSQVLDALKEHNDNRYTRDKGLYYLKGHKTDNNDFLARKVNTLSLYGMNSDSLINKLLSSGEFVQDNGSITNAGWGAYLGFKYSAYETALSLKAIRQIITSERSSKYDQLNNYGPLFLNLRTQWKWQRDAYFGSNVSVYISALAYSLTNNAGIGGWLVQNPDGSFGDGLIDTAGILLYLNLNSSAEAQALNYIISQQNSDGSFGDLSTTAISLEALTKGN